MAQAPTSSEAKETIKGIDKQIIKENLKVEKIEAKEHKDAKSEKLEKNEAKEHKDAKHEKVEKNETKEHKDAKNEKLEKNELKEHKDVKHEKSEIKDSAKIEQKEFVKNEIKELEKLIVETQNGNPVVDPIEQRISTLEQNVTSLQHFISSGERPDLSRGALSGEPAPKKTPG
jgi:hypothetical protein